MRTACKQRKIAGSISLSAHLAARSKAAMRRHCLRSATTSPPFRFVGAGVVVALFCRQRQRFLKAHSPCRPFSGRLQRPHHRPSVRRRFRAADCLLGIGSAALRPFGLRYKWPVGHSRAAPYFFCIHLSSSLPPQTEPLRCAGSRPAGSISLLRCLGLGHEPPPQDFFSHNPPHKQNRQR